MSNTEEMNMKRIYLTIFLVLSSCGLFAQQDGMKVKFEHLDLAVTAGSTGLGFDLATHMNEYVRLRAGAAFIPQFNYRMSFGVQVGDEAESKFDEYGNRVETRFDRLANLLESMTGLRVDDRVDMLGSPRMNNFKFMIDLFPLKNKHWSVSVGAYIGKSCFAKAKNTMGDMSSLMAVSIYNNMYNRILAEEPLFDYRGMTATLPTEFTDVVRSYGKMSMPIGEFVHDVEAQQDVLYEYNVIDDITGEVLHAKGDVRVAQGEVLYHKGEEYRMIPGQDNMVRVKATNNVFRPYVGIGYEGSISKNERLVLGANAGVMMWGGRPNLITHEGVDLIHDLTNVHGKVGNYVRLAKKFPVYPVLEFRLAYRIF